MKRNELDKYINIKTKRTRKDKRLVSQDTAHRTHCETPNMFPAY